MEAEAEQSFRSELSNDAKILITLNGIDLHLHEITRLLFTISSTFSFILFVFVIYLLYKSRNRA